MSIRLSHAMLNATLVTQSVTLVGGAPTPAITGTRMGGWANTKTHTRPQIGRKKIKKKQGIQHLHSLEADMRGFICSSLCQPIKTYNKK